MPQAKLTLEVFTQVPGLPGPETIKQKTGNLIPPRLRASSRCEGCELIEIDGDGGAHDIGGKLDFFPCKVLSGVDIVNYVTGISLRVWHSGRV